MVPHRPNDDVRTPFEAERREFLAAGVLFGLGLLGGCASGGGRSSLPNPRWPVAAPAVARRDPVTPAPVPSTGSGVSERIMSRSSWTRSGVSRPQEANPMGGVSRITVHHDGMPPVFLRSDSDVRERIEAIRRGHVGQGWADIGYHYAVDPMGRVWEARSVSIQGAHVKDQNEHNIAVLTLGNFEQQQPTHAQVEAVQRFVSDLMEAYRVPLSRVYTHRELGPSVCPGRNMQVQMERLRGPGGALAMAARRLNLG